MFFVTSKFTYYIKDEAGVKYPCVIPDTNRILSLIKKHLLGTKSLLIVANDPQDFAINDLVASNLSKACEMTNLRFDEVKVLDHRTMRQAKNFIKNADLIYMCGGEILRQLTFLQNINFKNLIENYNGVVVTVSAASMCLTKTICNFPEHEKEISQPRIVDGLGFIDLKIIPHFDAENLAYQGTTELPNLVEDYILPYSDNDKIYALPNGSYIMFDRKNIKFYGPYCIICDRKVEALNI